MPVAPFYGERSVGVPGASLDVMRNDQTGDHGLRSLPTVTLTRQKYCAPGVRSNAVCPMLPSLIRASATSDEKPASRAICTESSSSPSTRATDPKGYSC